MPATGTSSTRLLILRGNSGSGKTSTAKALQSQRLNQLTVVSQDVVRRDILKVHDREDNPSIDLIDLIVRYSLDMERDVVLEGMLRSQIYGSMLRRLASEHRGVTRCYRYELSFAQTLVRHASKPNAHEYGADLMGEWYRADDSVDGLDEKIIGPEEAQSATIARLATAMGWESPGPS